MKSDSETAALLKEYALRYETADFLDGDPSRFMHSVRGADDQETLAFIASVFSFGNRRQFMAKIQTLSDCAAGKPYEWISSGAWHSAFAGLDGDRFYRFFTCGQLRRLFARYEEVLNTYGGIGRYLRQLNVSDGYSAAVAICNLFGGNAPLIPGDVRSACKRICMFTRWMVRDNSAVDIGLWRDFIDKRTLIMPLDVHVLRQANRLSLIQSQTACMAVARRLTAKLAGIFPDDPLRGDFALFGYGVNNRG